MEIFKLHGSVLVDTDEANKSLAKTDEKAEGLGKKLQGGIKTAGKWAAGIGAAAGAVGAAMIATAKSTASTADEIDKASQRMKIGAESYQELAHAAELSGVDMGTLEKAAKKLEGTDLNLDDALAQIYELGTAEERSAKAAELFGESVAYSMTPMLNASAEEMAAMKDEAHELGLVMSEDAVKSGAAMNDSFAKVEDSIGAIKNTIGTALMPIIADLLDWVIDNLPKIQETVTKVIDVASKGFELIGGLWTDYLQPIFEGLLTFLDGVFTGDWEKIFQGLYDIVKGIFEGIVQVVKIPINGIIELLNKAIDGFNNIQIPDWVPLVGGKGLNIPHIPQLANGGDIQSAGTVMVGEAGPEFLSLPTGARVTPLDKAETIGTEIDYDKLAEAVAGALKASFEGVSDTGLYRIVQKESRRNSALGRPSVVV